MLLYRLGLLGYRLLLWIVSAFHPKAKQFLKGRKGLFEDLETVFSQHDNPVFWIHCASLGEFEQGRSLIESWKKEFPDHKILLTFFSPSGYEVRKDYPLADAVFYLPLDSPKNAKRFLDVARPSVAVFVKYEFWHFFLQELQRRDIPAISVAAIFRPEQYFFKSFGGFGRKILRLFSHFFVQDDSSQKLLQKIGITSVDVTGDPRLDRVAQIQENPKRFPKIERFLEGQPAFVIGSAWVEDVDATLVGISYLMKEKAYKIIIAPHEIGEANLRQIESRFYRISVRYTQLDSETSQKAVLILDTIGMLSSVYNYAQLAYVGGAFGKGLHNTMEAAVYGIPVLFGNRNYQKFREASDLIARDAAFPVKDRLELRDKIQRLMEQPNLYKQAGAAAADYVRSNRGATKKIIEHLKTIFTTTA